MAWKDGVSLGDAVKEAVTLAGPLLRQCAADAARGSGDAEETPTAWRFTFGFAIHHHLLLVLAAQSRACSRRSSSCRRCRSASACAVFALVITGSSLNIYSQIGLVLLVGVSGQERHPDRRVRQPAAPIREVSG